MKHNITKIEEFDNEKFITYVNKVRNLAKSGEPFFIEVGGWIIERKELNGPLFRGRDGQLKSDGHPTWDQQNCDEVTLTNYFFFVNRVFTKKT